MLCPEYRQKDSLGDTMMRLTTKGTAKFRELFRWNAKYVEESPMMHELKGLDDEYLRE